MLFENNKIKGSFFLTILPDSINNIVDNLSSYNILKFAKIKS